MTTVGQGISGRDPAVGRARAQTRELLLDAVSYLVSERNSLTFSLSEVAARAGVNSALVKYYFGNKSGMLVALLERDLAPHLKALDDLLKLDMPPPRKMRIHLEGMIRAYYRQPFINRLLGHLLREADEAQGRTIHERYVEPVINAYRVLIEEGVRKGHFRPVDPLLFYISAVGMCDHLVASRPALQFALGPGGLDEALCRRYADHITGVVLHGIVA